MKKERVQFSWHDMRLKSWVYQAGAFHVLKNITLTVKEGEKLVISGSSGSGKSTLIRCINGSESHQIGNIIVDGAVLNNNVKHLESIRRNVGMLFQHFNLFPHLSVLDNLMLGSVQVLKKNKKDAHDIAMKYFERVQIADQAHKFPG